MPEKRTWQETARQLYFKEHLKIITVSEMVEKSRQTVSSYLQTLPEWEDEQEYRRVESEKRRKRQKRFWEMLHRTEPNLKREHEIAVSILSREKYH